MANPVWYEVPAGSKPTQCRGEDCKAEMYWVRVGGRAIPVDCDVEGGNEPSETSDETQGDLLTGSGLAPVYAGRGVNHFTTCPNANDFHRKVER